MNKQDIIDFATEHGFEYSVNEINPNGMFFSLIDYYTHWLSVDMKNGLLEVEYVTRNEGDTDSENFYIMTFDEFKERIIKIKRIIDEEIADDEVQIKINGFIYTLSTERIKGKTLCLCMVDDEMYGEEFEYDGRFDNKSDAALQKSGLMDDTYKILTKIPAR